MKLQDLFKQQVDIELPPETTELDFKGVTVNGNFDASKTHITSLEGAPSHVDGYFNCANTNIPSLHNIHKQIKYIGGTLFLPNTIGSHILGVMFIKGLKKITFLSSFDQEQKQVEKIINNHLAGDRNIHDVQEELIEAGLKEYARL